MAHLLRLLCALLFALVFVPVFRSGVHATARPLAVVVSASTLLKDISTATLRRAFMGEPTDYASGKRLIPFNHSPTAATRQQFDLAVLGLRPDEVGRFWVDRRVRDQPAPPRIVPSVELALRVVMSLAGAITYVTPELVNDKVRALTIDGKAVGQPGYLLAR